MPRHGDTLPPPVLAVWAPQHEAKLSPVLRQARLKWAKMGNWELGHKPSKAAVMKRGREKVVHCWYDSFPGSFAKISIVSGVELVLQVCCSTEPRKAASESSFPWEQSLRGGVCALRLQQGTAIKAATVSCRGRHCHNTSCVLLLETLLLFQQVAEKLIHCSFFLYIHYQEVHFHENRSPCTSFFMRTHRSHHCACNPA